MGLHQPDRSAASRWPGTFRKFSPARMAAAGVQLMSWFGVACELHRDWRNDIEGLGALFSNQFPITAISSPAI